MSVYSHAFTVVNGDKWSTKPQSQMIMKCSLSSNLNPSQNSGFNLQPDTVSLAEFDKCMHASKQSLLILGSFCAQDAVNICYGLTLCAVQI